MERWLLSVALLALVSADRDGSGSRALRADGESGRADGESGRLNNGVFPLLLLSIFFRNHLFFFSTGDKHREPLLVRL